MRVLVIKLTSMGDVIHALPALTDAQKAVPDIQFDFVVEESFKEIPAWHQSVNKVIPVASRRWRKNLWKSKAQICHAHKEIKSQKYDVIIDAQGLGKSAFISALAKGVRHGYDKASIRESFASRFYHKRHTVSLDSHAVFRIRALFAKSLSYELHESELDYGISVSDLPVPVQTVEAPSEYFMFLHGTTWLAKEWPERYWRELASKMNDAGNTVFIPWGSTEEHLRAQGMAEGLENIHVLPKMSISDVGQLIAKAKGLVTVDTGLGHLSAAFSIPTIGIYGPTDTKLIGTKGGNQKHLCAVESPQWNKIKKTQAFDYGKISPDLVIKELQGISKR